MYLNLLLRLKNKVPTKVLVEQHHRRTTVGPLMNLSNGMVSYEFPKEPSNSNWMGLEHFSTVKVTKSVNYYLQSYPDLLFCWLHSFGDDIPGMEGLGTGECDLHLFSPSSPSHVWFSISIGIIRRLFLAALGHVLQFMPGELSALAVTRHKTVSERLNRLE